ncbi:Tripartite ATP-independent periplasmic transporters, DctQ component [Marinomonas spartinae]|uniref:TRAP transporter small permease n=1 Tax=Marinomonas spartinae TaxID=1792290 RepID=UPI000808F141|nr:TRAP transporter small permease [Marinomonas spartinae]SBS34376.1 Tripartite ATP-independent periplasmic transporters, DctQ component [Marinomonas spartinae]
MYRSPYEWLTTAVNQHHGDLGLAKWLAFLLEAVSAVMLFALMVLTCSDVIGRYVFSNSINGTTELTELALGIIVFCQIPVVTLTGAHVVVDILDRVLPDWFANACSFIMSLSIGIGCIFVADRIWFQALRSLRRGVVTEFLLIPVSYFVQFIAIMMYLTAAILIYKAITSLFCRKKEAA